MAQQQIEIALPQTTTPDEQPRIPRSMQWFFLALIALWLILSILAPIVAFITTNNLLCLTAFIDIAPPTYLLYFLAKRIFPPGDSETKIELARLHIKT